MLEELFAVQDLAGFRELLARRPELLGRSVQDELRVLAAHEAYGPPFRYFAELLNGAHADLDDAWENYARARREVDQLIGQLDGVDDEIEAAANRGDFDVVIDLTEDAIPKAKKAGLGMLAADLQGQRGVAYLNRASPNRAEDLEVAIEALEEAVELTAEPEEAAKQLMHLALVWGERVRGDRAEKRLSGSSWNFGGDPRD